MAPVEVLAQVSERGPAAAPARSIRRATARRASARRAFARSRHRDDATSITGFLTDHPHSTVGDLAELPDAAHRRRRDSQGVGWLPRGAVDGVSRRGSGGFPPHRSAIRLSDRLAAAALRSGCDRRGRHLRWTPRGLPIGRRRRPEPQRRPTHGPRRETRLYGGFLAPVRAGTAKRSVWASGHQALAAAGPHAVPRSCGVVFL
jgi:hypothetical protein